MQFGILFIVFAFAATLYSIWNYSFIIKEQNLLDPQRGIGGFLRALFSRPGHQSLSDCIHFNGFGNRFFLIFNSTLRL